MSILKWVGGKRQLLDQLQKSFPGEVKKFYEPFGGSLTVTLRVLEMYPNVEEVHVADINPKLMNLYIQVRDHLSDFEKLFRETMNKNDEYYIMRDRFNFSRDPLEQAVLLFILNKKCFNGLYRVNKKGHFNVPEGKNQVNWEQQISNLKNFSEILNDKRVHLYNMDFKTFFEKFSGTIDDGDLTYIDPPYWETFTGYDGSEFTESDQRYLKDCAATLKGTVVCSNSNTPFTKELYKDFQVQEVNARRSINRNASKRGPTNVEIICVKSS